jgi:hypothetical protein
MYLDIRKLSVAFAAAALALACATASAFTKPPFPRIAGIQIGSPFNYDDATYQASLAKQSVTVLGMYPGLAPGGSLNTQIQAIKAKNPNALIFLYTNANELGPASSSGDAYASYRAKLDSMKWWAYSDGSLTTPVASAFGTGFLETNQTLFTPKDSNGDTAVEWIAKFYVNSYYKTTPAIDGLYMDNVFRKPIVDADWNRDGKVDLQSDPTVQSWYRQGYARYFGVASSLMPGKFQIGNIGDWAETGSVPPEYQNMIQGGVLESYIGQSWSVESWAGWQGMMTRYTLIMAALLDPKLGIFNQWGDSTDYQSMRYGLTSTLMNDGYYSFSDSSSLYHGVAWFDEFDSKLGQATSLPPTAAWQKGVWRRDFDNGIALVNPKGNGPQTVTLETAYVKLKGTQDPVTNNGQTVTTVTLQDRDGIILLRPNPVKRPAAPQKLSASSG